MRTTIATVTAAAASAALALAAAPGASATTLTPQANPAPAIVGGTPAPSAYPGTGSLQLADHGDPDWHTCGVTLIAPQWALTNAHCVTNPPTAPQIRETGRQAQASLASFRVANDDPIDRTDPAIYHIRFGSPDRLAGGVVRRLDRIVVPSGWRWGQPDAEGRVWDIAVLHLSTPVYSVPAAVLAPVVGWRPAREIGWGRTNPDPATWTGPAPRQLSQVDAPVAPSRECAAGGIGAGEVCLGAATNGGGACEGDSGSAAVQRIGSRWAVVGTTSRGIADHCGTANIYTRPFAFLGWLIIAVRGVDPHTQIATADDAVTTPAQ